MAVRAPEVAAVLLDRLGAAFPAPALFSHDETTDWPPGLLAALLDVRILQPTAEHVAPVVCPGCEWQCPKPIVIRTGRRTTRAFVVCDEPPALGRVEISLNDLRHYQVTLRSVADFLCHSLEQPPPQRQRHPNAYALGFIRGRHGPRAFSVACTDGAVVFTIDHHSERLNCLLRWDGAAMSVDAALIRRLANRKSSSTSSARPYRGDRSRQIACSRATLQRNHAIHRDASRRYDRGEGSWSTIANVIALSPLAMDGRGRPLDPATVRRIISQMRTRERKNSRSNRTTRK